MSQEKKLVPKDTGLVIEEKLLNKLPQLTEGKTARVIIKMQEQPMVSTAMNPHFALRSLVNTAEQTQKPVIDYLTRQIRGESVQKYKCFWLVNLIFAELNSVQINDLAKLPEVARIYEDVLIKAHVETVKKSQWDNIGFVQAPEVWAQGFRGQNVKVAVVDTGVDINHPELLGAMGGNPPYYEGFWVEFDQDGNAVQGSTPHDSDMHGTHVSGTAVGRNRNLQIGMAPEAILGHALVLPEGNGTMPQVLAGLQWAIENGFKVVNGSWGGNDISPDLAEAVKNLVTAGVFPAFSSGNEGPGQTSSPGNTPLAEAVGAFDAAGNIADFSSGGVVEYPNYTYASEQAKIKPDISAPGVGITSSIPGGKYATFDGTSMASPHVAGAAALIYSKNPELTVQQVKNLLNENTGGMVGLVNDPGTPGKDDRYGWGRLNVLQAIEKTPDSGPNGTVQGYVQGQNEFVSNAAPTFNGPEKKTLITDVHGFYQASLREGVYKVTVTARAYLPEAGEIQITNGQTTIANFNLEPAPLGTIMGSVRDSETGIPLVGVMVEVAGTALKTETDSEGHYTLEVKEGRYDIHFLKEGYHPLTIEEIPVLPNETVEADVEMIFGYHNVLCQIEDAEGVALPYVFVDVPETGDTVFTDGTGYFVLSLPAGEYTIELDKAGYQHRSNVLKVEHGQMFEGHLEMVIQPGEMILENHFDVPGDWEKWSATGGWHVTNRRYVTPQGSIWHGDEASGKYPNNQTAIIKLQNPLTVPQEGKTSLNFRMWAQIERDYDFLVVNLESEGRKDVLYKYSAPTRKWQNIIIDLTRYAGKEIILGFEFNSDSSVTYQGVFIDDITVFTAQ